MNSICMMLCLLYHEVEKNRITEELLLCMQHEEGAQEKIEAYNNVQKKAFVDGLILQKQNKLKQTVLPKSLSWR